MIQKVLAIETSCDDTSVAIVGNDGRVFSMVSAAQDLEHAPYGGIVPEIASRNHTRALLPLVEKALEKGSFSWGDIQGIAVTNRPGLVGALIVGLVTAKSLAQSLGIPFIGVNHLEGHLLAPFLKDSEYQSPQEFDYPYVALAISGGHTSLYLIHEFGKYEVLGATKDDAAGEAFDKFAKMLGLGFPGGIQVDQLARNGDVNAYPFPRSMIHDDTFDMSFSGLKSSAQRLIQKLGQDEVEKNKANLCASFQEAIVDILIAKLGAAAERCHCQRMILTGGVSANSRLRDRANEWALKKNMKLILPPLRYCTDNAAMIGYVGIRYLNKGISSDLSLGPYPQLLPTDFN